MSNDYPTDDPALEDQGADDQSQADPALEDQGADDQSQADPALEGQGTDEQAAPSSGAAVAHASRHENPTDRAESLGTGLGDQATGDIVIDSALQDLQNAPSDDLDAQIDAGQRVQQTLQARLSDLGGE